MSSANLPQSGFGRAIDLSGVVRNTSGAASERPAAPGSSDGPASAVSAVVFDTTDSAFEQVLELSQTVPVVVDLWAEWCTPCKTLGPILEKVTREQDGRLVLAKVDVDQNPGLAQAFQAQSIPTVVALVGGQVVPLFQGAIPEEQVRQVFAQLRQLAEQHGVNGRVTPDAAPDETDEVAETPVNPEHEAALRALEAGDFERAIAEYEQVLVRSPFDEEARAALLQVQLLHRLAALDAEQVRTDAAQRPDDVDAQMLVADLDVAGGHVEDGFLRLLDVFARTTAEDRPRVQQRLLDLFEVVGTSDPRVIAARGRLASLLF